MTTATINISLPVPMKEFIEGQVKAGGYSTTSEYVRELIRRDQVLKAEARLRELIEEGLNSGPGVAADDAFFEGLKMRLARGPGTV